MARRRGEVTRRDEWDDDERDHKSKGEIHKR